MSAVFLKAVNLSISASWLILAVILARFLLKKAPKWSFCVLWALVGVRLICPFSLESRFSLLPRSEWIAQTQSVPPQLTAPETVSIPAIAGKYPGTAVSIYIQQPEITVHKSVSFAALLPYIWLAGIAALLLYALISYLRLKKRVGASIPLSASILACDEVRSPFILGVIRPVIYVPSAMDGETLRCVIAHETAHIARRDHWWKPLGYLILAVYWFNPLTWLAYILLCRDIEAACDEKVVRTLDHAGRAAYSQALLNCSFSRKRIAVCPVAFGETGVKGRVRSVLNYKKPAFWIVAAAIIVCAVLAVCFLTNPKKTSAAPAETVTPPVESNAPAPAGEETPEPAEDKTPAADETPNILGYSCRIEDEDFGFSWHQRSYIAADESGKEFTVAESYGFEIDDHVVDIDGDGVNELLCNCVAGGDGHQDLYLYRVSGSGQIEVGLFDTEKVSLEDWFDWGVNSLQTCYSPEENALVVTYSATDESTRTLLFDMTAEEMEAVMSFRAYPDN